MAHLETLTRLRAWHTRECGCDMLIDCDTRSASAWRSNIADASAFNA